MHITEFDANRYLGTWYEIARLDHSFERGLQQVTAEYSLREDGGIRVVNKGFNKDGKRWERADGKAYFIEADNVGRLKVSFFGPFLDQSTIDHLLALASMSGFDTSQLIYIDHEISNQSAVIQ